MTKIVNGIEIADDEPTTVNGFEVSDEDTTTVGGFETAGEPIKTAADEYEGQDEEVRSFLSAFEV
jgi:hypothetical protein